MEKKISRKSAGITLSVVFAAFFLISVAAFCAAEYVGGICLALITVLLAAIIFFQRKNLFSAILINAEGLTVFYRNETQHHIAWANIKDAVAVAAQREDFIYFSESPIKETDFAKNRNKVIWVRVRNSIEEETALLAHRKFIPIPIRVFEKSGKYGHANIEACRRVAAKFTCQ